MMKYPLMLAAVLVSFLASTAVAGDDPLYRPDAWLLSDWNDSKTPTHMQVGGSVSSGPFRLGIAEHFDGWDHAYGSLAGDYTIVSEVVFARLYYELAIPSHDDVNYEGTSLAVAGLRLVDSGPGDRQPNDTRNLKFWTYGLLGKQTNGPWVGGIRSAVSFDIFPARGGATFELGIDWRDIGRNQNMRFAEFFMDLSVRIWVAPDKLAISLSVRQPLAVARRFARWDTVLQFGLIVYYD